VVRNNCGVGRIEDWTTLCHLVFKRWDRDQHHTFMHQILALKQLGSIVEYIEMFEDLRHQVVLHDLQLALSSLWLGS
jgi:hypothetical protein